MSSVVMVFVRTKLRVVELNELELAIFQKFLDYSEGDARRKRSWALDWSPGAHTTQGWQTTHNF
jgi:hypothetical protein